MLDEGSFKTALERSLKDKCAMIPVNVEALRWGARAVREEITQLEAPAD